MKNYNFRIILIIIMLGCTIISSLTGCGGTYRYQLRSIKPMKGKEKSEIQIFLKNGDKFNLTEFEVFTEKVIGIDSLGNRREVPLDSIEKIFIIKESSTSRKIASTVVITGLISYFVFILLIAIVGVPGGSLQ